VAPLPPLDRAEEWLHAQPASLSEARRMLMAIPARDPNTPAGLLDLERHYSGGLAQPWQGLVGNNLGTLPHGVQRMKSGVFDIRGVVLPDGVGRPSTIQVGRTCERLRFLHNATHRSMEPKPGMTIGRYVIHYADSQTAEVPLVIGRTIQHWWSDPATLESSGEAEVAWIGTNDLSRQSDRTIHLLGLIWTNPRPEVPVTSFDFEQAGADFRPFLVAVTAE
jgi:hypothetical protein